MKVLDKILYLQKSVNLNDRKFAKRYKIHLNSFKLWKLFKKEPNKNAISYLVESFNLDLEDFMNGNSTLLPTLEAHEHACKTKESTIEDKNLIYEDFAREENGRYEEKD